MAEKIMMLALSPTMEMGTIAKWNAKEGDTIANGDVICEVETDKATMDYEAMVDGTLLKIVLPEGGQAKVGDTIAIVGKRAKILLPWFRKTKKNLLPFQQKLTRPKLFRPKLRRLKPLLPTLRHQQQKRLRRLHQWRFLAMARFLPRPWRAE
jgi:pyruvate/2-oxoglutarate dehydrogenase complex dihydrolipoamide acyltransferase (E2) component